MPWSACRSARAPRSWACSGSRTTDLARPSGLRRSRCSRASHTSPPSRWRAPACTAAAQEELQERRRAEAALREAELRYRTLVEHLPLVTYISPADEAVGNLYVSPQVEALLGYPAEEWIQNPTLLNETVHPDDLERVLADAERLRETGEPLRSEYRYIAADGRIIWVLDETILVRDEGGTPLWVQGFLVDITERKLAEETRARLAAIVESSSDAITSASLDLRLTSWNAGAERMFGRPADEMVGQQITTVIPEGRRRTRWAPRRGGRPRSRRPARDGARDARWTPAPHRVHVLAHPCFGRKVSASRRSDKTSRSASWPKPTASVSSWPSRKRGHSRRTRSGPLRPERAAAGARPPQGRVHRARLARAAHTADLDPRLYGAPARRGGRHADR